MWLEWVDSCHASPPSNHTHDSTTSQRTAPATTSQKKTWKKCQSETNKPAICYDYCIILSFCFFSCKMHTSFRSGRFIRLLGDGNWRDCWNVSFQILFDSNLGTVWQRQRESRQQVGIFWFCVCIWVFHFFAFSMISRCQLVIAVTLILMDDVSISLYM